MLFKATKFVVICHGSNINLIYNEEYYIKPSCNHVQRKQASTNMKVVGILLWWFQWGCIGNVGPTVLPRFIFKCLRKETFRVVTYRAGE